MDTAINETIIELENDELEYNESEKNKGTVNTDIEAKQPIPANNSQDKAAKVTEDEEAAEAGVDVRIMDNLIDEETSDLSGMKNDGAHDGVEDRAVGSRRRKMGHSGTCSRSTCRRCLWMRATLPGLYCSRAVAKVPW